MIHPTAIVAPDVEIGEGVEIGPYAVVEAGVEIGAGSRLHSHAVLLSGARLGERVTVHSFAVIGGLPQSLHFDPATPTGVAIGDGSVLREGVTVNRATKEGASTVLGRECFLMANAHVAHDCVLGDHVVAANDVMIAGHCEIGDHVFLGGGCGLHQFLRVGPGVMIGGHASLSFDVPPYVTVAERNCLFGLNLVGLRRRGVAREVIRELKALYRRVFAARNPRQEAARALEEAAYGTEEGRIFLAFFGGGSRGICRPASAAVSGEEPAADGGGA
ncbi:MAG: acyl-ACP--UDP-N-acetylglucosamine O-acyltransferase [Verrucomicrobia bacterium]|nr:MAG: acyl-ACP--UDP-N-acetylglucosamine O-acyltransferase [Verrucomicrobiota bacterium]